MPSESNHSRRTRRSSSQLQHRTRSDPDMYILLLNNVPSHHKWQDVKDEIKVYAPHLSAHQFEEENPPPGFFSVEIRDGREEASNAYDALIRNGFRGAQVRIALMRKRGSESLVPLRGPRDTHRPPSSVAAATPRGLPYRQVIPQQMQIARAPPPQVAPLYPPPNRHAVPAGNMHDLDSLMQRMAFTPPPRLFENVPSQPSRLRHTTTTTAARNRRHSRDRSVDGRMVNGALVVDGTRTARRHSDSDDSSDED